MAGLKQPVREARMDSLMTHFWAGFEEEKSMNRTMERRLKDAVRFLGIKEKPLQKRKPKPSSTEARLMDAKKTFKRM